MKQFLLVLFSLVIANFASAQFVAKMELKEPVKGLCSKDVYALLPLGDQKGPECLTPEEELIKKLNSEVTYFKDSASYEDKGMVSIIINCKGEAVKCDIDNKTRHKELDDQIVAVFSTLTKWTPGKIKKKEVDSVKLWSFRIKNGQISID
ncbi:MAG TPA: hypothetical protein VKT28_11950 [Puia sp.]|nr:hypothetical protein [Puia sp.]